MWTPALPKIMFPFSLLSDIVMSVRSWYGLSYKSAGQLLGSLPAPGTKE